MVDSTQTCLYDCVAVFIFYTCIVYNNNYTLAGLLLIYCTAKLVNY